METSGTRSCYIRKFQSPCELRGPFQDSSPVASGTEVLIWSWGRNLRFPLQCQHGSRGSSGVSTGESGLDSCGDMQVCSPLELEKQCQISCRVDIGICGFLSRFHRAITPAIVFWVDPPGERRVSAGESIVSGVHWDIRVFWNGGTTPEVPLECQVETASSWYVMGTPGFAGGQHDESHPWQCHVEGSLTKCKVVIRLQVFPVEFPEHPPTKTRVCLLYCVMLSTYSSVNNRELSPHHLFFGKKINLELFNNKNPGHNMSVSIQKPFWWLSSLPAGLVDLCMWLFEASWPRETQGA